MTMTRRACYWRKEVCEILGVSTRTYRTMVKYGLLRLTKLQGMVRRRVVLYDDLISAMGRMGLTGRM